jgi:two-component system, NtrC family, sensor kinase
MTPPAPSSRQLLRWTILSLALEELVLLTSVWGRWRTMAVLLGLYAVRITGNVLMLFGPGRPGRRPLGTGLMLGLNVAITLADVHVLEWNLLAWLHVLLQVVFMNVRRTPDNRAQYRFALGLLLPLVALLALAEGVAPSTVVPVCLLAWLVSSHQQKSHERLLDALETARDNHDRLRRMQEQLLAQEKLTCLGALAAGVAHEINNPMAFVTSNIRGLVRDLSAQPQLTPELREYVDEVLPETLEGIRRVNAIVADLKRFARSDQEPPVPFDLNQQVTSALRHTQAQLTEHCRVEVDLHELPPLVGRPRQINQVVVNLLLNAAQSLAQQGGVVRVSTRAERDEVCVEVTDNGVGMSNEVLRSAFLPFFTTRPVGNGTGLGLAAAYGIVTGHGGRIDVESAPYQGTRVCVHLPQNARP